MRHLTIFVTICLLFSFAACKKNSDGDIHHANPANEFKATISESGKPDISINVKGDNTMFDKEIYTTGDTVITVGGGNDPYLVVLHLENITGAGTYHFIPAAGADPRQLATCSYTIGSGYNITRSCVSGDHSAGEIVTITNLTATHIEGSFSVTCSDPYGDVLVKNATFKGDFQ